MKKIVLMAGAALATLAFASCSNCDKTSCDANGAQKSDVDALYTGILPAADCDGVMYNLILDYDHEDNDGDYTLVENYMQTDTASVAGFKSVASYVSEGDFTIEKKDNKTVLKLVKDTKDSAQGSIDTPLYFLVDSESSITLVNQDLEVSTTPGMNYTLTKAK